MSDPQGMNGAGAFFAGNQHNDVLFAKPDGAEAVARLVEELKRRGNAAVKFESFPEAEALYSKAIEHDSKNVALYGNRAMVRGSMGRFKEALEDAEAAIAVNPEWVKGYYRKATSLAGLKRFDEAKAAFEEVLNLDPKNKAAKAELDKIPARKAAHEASEARIKERQAEENAKGNTVAARVPISRKVIDVKKEASTKANAAEKPKATDENDVDLSMRGYRTLADGRKTTYFNRELTEEEKELLKDNAPKQVASTEEISEQEKKLAQEGASAWNQGGTFEEKAMSEWAHARLKELLVGTKVPISIQDADGDVVEEEIKVTGLLDLEGDASITFTRGKKRHIFDFNFSATWRVMVDGKTIKGEIYLGDVSGDAVLESEPNEPLEAELRWSDRGKAGTNEARIKEAVMSNGEQGLLGALSRAVHAFATEFRSMN
mmetsp:Transcript_13450/g.23933  ORF Transcript_13450/g.23933 Transcript_13450/m.23933 type:complete len:431 (+) Transcript_13450:177-1469(+)